MVLVLALLLAVGASEREGNNAHKRLSVALEQIVDSDMECIFAIPHVRRLFRSMVVLGADYLLAASDAERRAMDKKMESLAKQQLEQVEKCARLMPAADQKALDQLSGARPIGLNSTPRYTPLQPRITPRPLASPSAKQHAIDPVNWETAIRELVQLTQVSPFSSHRLRSVSGAALLGRLVASAWARIVATDLG